MTHTTHKHTRHTRPRTKISFFEQGAKLKGMMVSAAQDKVVCVCTPRIPSLADPLEGMLKFNVIGALCHPCVCVSTRSLDAVLSWQDTNASLLR